MGEYDRCVNGERIGPLWEITAGLPNADLEVKEECLEEVISYKASAG